MSRPDQNPAQQLLSMQGDISPDEVCESYAEAGVSLKTRMLKNGPGEEGVPLILIEGDKHAFLFLADLLLAQAQADDCGSQLSPTGPGNKLFDPASEFGLYLHVLPCSKDRAPVHNNCEV